MRSEEGSAMTVIPPTNSPGPLDPDEDPPTPPDQLDDYEEGGILYAFWSWATYNPLLDSNQIHRHPGSPEARPR